VKSTASYLLSLLFEHQRGQRTLKILTHYFDMHLSVVGIRFRIRVINSWLYWRSPRFSLRTRVPHFSAALTIHHFFAVSHHTSLVT